ncbi:MAG: nucleotide exchange factor GrpE [Prevotella sp.]|jgi:molecular chaperone GrpE|nr:nucleotide exchange factor GrpE [Prevotella sp.]MBQ5547510.1 nucleotide exchange factor GrpE [Prevotella sp.]
MKEEEKINVEEDETLENSENTESVEDTEKTEDAENSEPAEEKDPLEAAQAEIESLKTQILYKTAEFDNYRKRTLKEKAELILNGGEKAVSAILPVIDDMERAIDNGEKTDDPAVLREGMELIYQKFMKALESLGVKKIDTENADFDTDLHEAVAMVPGMGDDKKGKVIDCLQTGYQLNDKVIRHAKVAVGQ